jgi:hypothetical protein
MFRSRRERWLEHVALAVGGEVRVGFGGDTEGKGPLGSYGIILKWVLC